MIRKIAYAVLAVLAVSQFIRPPKNESIGASSADISQVYTVPADVQRILVQSCYDCHSNNTRYPWYAQIQPVGWWLNSHIQEGKEHLNFSEFATYRAKKANHKLEEVEEAVMDGWMPLDSYLWVHGDARLTPEQAQAVAEWARQLRSRQAHAD